MQGIDDRSMAGQCNRTPVIAGKANNINAMSRTILEQAGGSQMRSSAVRFDEEYVVSAQAIDCLPGRLQLPGR
jgi:hypothetical protein